MKPYKCDLCKMSISQSGNLNKHKSTHTRVKHLNVISVRSHFHNLAI
jgi:hypothetical protein